MKSKPRRLSEMVKQDLANIAEELPYTGQDHKANLLYHFKEGYWAQVNDYIDSVYALVKEAHVPYTPKNDFQALYSIIYQKWCECMDWILKFAVEAKTWLNR